MLRSIAFLVVCAAPLCIAAQPVKCPPYPGRINVASGSYSSQPGVTFKLRGFAADMVSPRRSSPLCFVRTAVVERGEVFVSSETLSHVFEQKLEQANSKITDVKIETGDGTARLSGKVKKVVPIPFTIEGPITTDGTVITLEAKKIKADGVPVKLLLEMVGGHVSSLMNASDVTGVKVDGNKLSFDPEKLGHIRGTLTQALTSPHGLTLKYLDVHERNRTK
jgi:hypothetical protein